GSDDPVSTYHDRIRESVLAALAPETLTAHHLALGRALAARASTGVFLFEVVRHLRAASSRLSADERANAARLHLEAGRQARQAAAFPLAFACFEGGIALAGDDVWTRDYPLALALHAGAAESAYLSAEWSALERRIADLKTHARTPMDQLVAWELQIDASIGRRQYAAAVDAGMDALAQLGVVLPRDPGQAEVAAAFQRALGELTRVGPTRFAELPDVGDPQV